MDLICEICEDDFFPGSEGEIESLLLQGLADYCVRCEKITIIGELENGLCPNCRKGKQKKGDSCG